MALTLNTGTTAPTAVSIDGDLVNADENLVYIYEQTSGGTPISSNSLLMGNATTTRNATFPSFDQDATGATGDTGSTRATGSTGLTADGQVVHGTGIESAELAFIDPGVPALS